MSRHHWEAIRRNSHVRILRIYLLIGVAKTWGARARPPPPAQMHRWEQLLSCRQLHIFCRYRITSNCGSGKGERWRGTAIPILSDPFHEPSPWAKAPRPWDWIPSNNNECFQTFHLYWRNKVACSQGLAVNCPALPDADERQDGLWIFTLNHYYRYAPVTPREIVRVW